MFDELPREWSSLNIHFIFAEVLLEERSVSENIWWFKVNQMLKLKTSTTAADIRLQTSRNDVTAGAYSPLRQGRLRQSSAVPFRRFGGFPTRIRMYLPQIRLYDCRNHMIELIVFVFNINQIIIEWLLSACFAHGWVSGCCYGEETTLSRRNNQCACCVCWTELY